MNEPRVVAVVCTYWPKRMQNVQQILHDLQSCSRPPDRIILLNNDPSRFWRVGAPVGVDVIDAPWNTTCRGKFIVPLLDVADYYLLLDDDTSVQPRTIEALLRHSRESGVTCTGYLGCWVDWHADGGPSLFSQQSQRSGRLWPRDATVVQTCDTFCGCGMWMSFEALARMVALESKVRTPGKWPDEGDDLIAGLANRSHVVPLAADEDFKNLGEQGEAMNTSIDDYYGMRDRFLRDVLRAQGRL